MRTAEMNDRTRQCLVTLPSACKEKIKCEIETLKLLHIITYRAGKETP
jgi:hypothetical protein